MGSHITFVIIESKLHGSVHLQYLYVKNNNILAPVVEIDIFFETKKPPLLRVH